MFGAAKVADPDGAVLCGHCLHLIGGDRMQPRKLWLLVSNVYHKGWLVGNSESMTDGLHHTTWFWRGWGGHVRAPKTVTHWNGQQWRPSSWVYMQGLLDVYSSFLSQLSRQFPRQPSQLSPDWTTSSGLFTDITNSVLWIFDWCLPFVSKFHRATATPSCLAKH